MRNTIGEIKITRKSETDFSPIVHSQSDATISMLKDCLNVLEIGESLNLVGVILKVEEDIVSIFTSVGLIITKQVNVDMSDEESDAIYIS
jgi:hypothetical protein